MTVSSWFRSTLGTTTQGSGNTTSSPPGGGNSSHYHHNPNPASHVSFMTNSRALQETLRLLHPPPQHNPNENRFSNLLLEHGEQCIQDWAVVAYSTPLSHADTDVYRSRTTTGTATSSGTATGHGRSWKGDGGRGGGGQVLWEQQPVHTSGRRAASGSLLLNPSSRRRYGGVTSRGAVVAPTPLNKESYPTAFLTKLEGRLFLCTRSIVFEPAETSRAIIRCPFAKLDGTPTEFPGEGYAAMCIQCIAKKHFAMKANGIVGPFQAVPAPVQFRFTFLHSSPTPFVELCQQLYQASTVSNKQRATQQQQQHSNHTTTTTTPTHHPELDTLLKPYLDRPFDMAHLLDVREPVLAHVRCYILTPLQAQPGVLVVTNERLYFQNTRGALEGKPWQLTNIHATARRYHGLRDCALEVYWANQTSTLLALERRHERELICRLLPPHVPCFTDRSFVIHVVTEWLRGTICNFDYLLALNSAAGRSFHDLSRYPVFPWVLADYESNKVDTSSRTCFRDLSKPVGALNEQRLDYFRTRLDNMQDMGEDFLYGTHYSAPGYVLYFLVRSMPEHMLCLQNGKFDAPDRMFHSIATSYRCVLTNHADVKELIPEFFHTANFDFLINTRGLQLGATQNGDRVNDVQLPPWARSARDFVKKNRQALESDICSQQLPQWIDLIFGYLSRGEAAKNVNNLFHRTAYLGPNDLAAMPTEEERAQAELQATEFGIVPDQLFVQAHPHKNNSGPLDEGIVSGDIGRASKDDFSSSREAWELLDPPEQASQNAMTALLRSDVPEQETPESTDAIQTSQWSKDREGNGATGNMMIATPTKVTGVPVPPGSVHAYNVASPTASNTGGTPPTAPESPPIPIAQFPSTNSKMHWDIKIIERRNIHNDAVSGCAMFLDVAPNEPIKLITTSLDGGLKAFNVSIEPEAAAEDKNAFSATLSRLTYGTLINRTPGTGQQSAVKSKLLEYRSHSSRDPLASLVVAGDGLGGSIAFAGGHDDVVLAYGVNSGCAVASVYSHRDAVTGLDLITRSPFDATSALWLENATHILVSGSWDATVKVWSVSIAGGETVSVHRDPVAELFDANSTIVCVSAKAIPTGGLVISAGCADGSFCVWNVHSDGVQVVLHNESPRRGSGPCSQIQWISTGGSLHMFAAFSSGKVASYSLVDGKVLQRRNAVSVGVGILSLAYGDNCLLLGCADGGLRLIPIRDGAYFETKPTLWNAMNHKESPGISMVSVTFLEPRQHNRTENTSNDLRRRCICCTGGDDGSIAIFELLQMHD